MLDTYIKKRSDKLMLLSLAMILIANAVFLSYHAFRCFNLFDMGAFLDASWRVFKGQLPYRDFFYYNGPLHLYMNAFFFHLFGFGKTAILAHLVVVHSIIITLVFFILAKRVPHYITLAVTLLAVPSFYWTIAHPWHDQSAHLWGIIGIALLAWNLPFKNTRTAFWISFCCGILTPLSYITKSNLGAGYGIMFFAVLLSLASRKQALLGYLSGGLTGVFLSLLILRLPVEFVQQTIIDNGSFIETRLSSILSLSNTFSNYYWLPLSIVLLNALISSKRTGGLLALFIGMSLFCIYSVSTGGVIIPANIFLWGIQMALGFLVLFNLIQQTNGWQKKLQHFSLWIFIGLTILLTLIAAQRGLALKVWTYKRPNPFGTYALKSKPLEGWLFHPAEGKALDDMTFFIQKMIPKEQSLLNLTDMYIIYALTGRDSFRNISFQFLENILPSPGQQTDMVHEHILHNPPDWILTHLGSYNEDIRILGLQEFVQTQYAPVMHSGFYILLKKRP